MTTIKMLTRFSDVHASATKLGSWMLGLALFVATLTVGPQAQAAVSCTDTIYADVVVFDSPTVFNRLGAQNPNWITYALKRDVVNSAAFVDLDGNPVPENSPNAVANLNKGVPCSMNGGNHCKAGNVELRSDKRPRPLVVRSVEGYCLDVTFTNLLDPVANSKNPQQGRPDQNPDENGNPQPIGTLEPDLGPFPGLNNNDQVVGRCASFHATGTELQSSMADDGAVVGSNDAGGALNGPTACGDPAKSGLVAPDQTHTYKLYTPHEGAFIINSYGATIGSEANSGNLAVGMFGALNVQPKGARIYRSQMTEEEFRLAIDTTIDYGLGDCPDPLKDPAKGHTCKDQPIINYEATYPLGSPWYEEGKAGLPIVNMIDKNGLGGAELVHSDINAIIAGPDADGSWRNVCPGADCPYPLESVGKRNPAYPNRLEAFREFTSQYHDEQTNSQVFPNWYANPVMQHVLHGVKDQFMINYGSGGIGSEIISNRLRTGPMHDCTDCAYEEFFLASQTVGDPALLVNSPANTGIEACSPTNILANGDDPNSCWRIPAADGLANGPIPGNYALYQEDPSNVHHAYTGDPVKMRNTHAGSFEQHIFHFHNHQWLFNPNDDNANYLDAQEIMPGSGHTYELVYGGAGNRNHTVGDAIFHCHFYPHFAQGMWYHMRNHDVYETGTVLAVSGAGPDKIPGTTDDEDPATNFHSKRFGLRSGQPAKDSRAYPDGELPDGSPIPAIVPLPGVPMPLMPAKVKIVAVDRGSHTMVGGRGEPDGIPDSSQAVVDHVEAAGADGKFGTPDDVTPGYPFWLAGNECGNVDFAATTGTVTHEECPMGIVGQRMPTPPLDMLTDDAAAAVNPDWALLGGGWDGGLPRHALLGYTSAGVSADTNNRLDFRKIVHLAQPVYFPETGTDLEKVSMAYQAVRHRDSYIPMLGGLPQEGFGILGFELNGAPAVPGGPYNDPCVDDLGAPLREGTSHSWFGGNGQWDTTRGGFETAIAPEYDGLNPRTYKLANLQIDAVFNKVGYHYAQERIIILWEDVKPTVKKERPPEPLVMRFNTFDCGKILHANLVPAEFEVDDFQVRTPTDIIGQHIHLPKWDLTSNDGAANGWNYEDGTLSPGMVHERALAINHYNLLVGRCASSGLCDLPQFYQEKDADGVVLWELHNLGPIDLRGLAQVATLPNACQEKDPALLDPNGEFDPTLDPEFNAYSPPQTFEDNFCGTPGGLLKLNDHLKHYFAGFRDTDNPQVGAGMYESTRTTIQRILVDPVFNVSGVDRGLGLTFSHDHYGPSTFQQIGLYSTILAEPAGSTWRHNETGELLNDYSVQADGSQRTDGGPTSWQAAIITPDTDPDTEGKQNDVPDHREFYFEMSDFQHAYESGAGYAAADKYGIPRKFQVDANGNQIKEIEILGDPNASLAGIDATIATADEIRNTWLQVVNPTLKLTAGGGREKDAFPDTVNAHPNCPGRAGQNDPSVPRPCGEAINIGHASMWVVNYRNEPIGLRVFDPNKPGPDGRDGTQADGQPGDLALAFQSRNDRAISALNRPLGCLNVDLGEGGSCLDTTPAYPQASYCQGTGDGINCDRNSGDPFTPIMRAYEHDHVKVKIQVGATEEQHQTTIHGVKWLSNGSGFGRSPNSGWRNFQSHGISEQFSLQIPIIPDRNDRGNATDYLYATDATRDGIWSGTWGLLRSYQNGRQDLYELPNNPMNGSANLANDNNFSGVCPMYVMDEFGEPIGSGKGKDKTLIPVPVRKFEVFAVRANDVLPNNLGVTIPTNLPDPDTGLNNNVGGPLDPDGGTLVYNRRAPSIEICDAGRNADGTCAGVAGDRRMVAGPLNDPTALMYVLEEDLEPRFIAGVSPDNDGWRCSLDVNDTECLGGEWIRGYDLVDDRCQIVKDNPGEKNDALHAAGCPVKLKADAPVEPLVLRAEAGDCIEATLRNKLADQATITRGTGANAETKLVYVGSNTGTPVFSDVLAAKHVGNLVDEDNTLLTLAEEAAIEFDIMPDLAGWQDTFWVVNRDLFKPVSERGKDSAGQPQMSFFGNNLIRPSAMAGLHAQLVEYDASQDDGVVVGQNPQSIIAGPGEQHTYRWYAGHIDTKFIGMSGKGKNQKRDFVRLAFPVEFGGANLLSADRIKQPQKGLFAALIIEPKGAIVTADTLVADGQMACKTFDSDGKCLEVDQYGTRKTRAQVDVEAPSGIAGSGGKYRETVAVTHKITNLRYADGSTVKNVGQAEFGVEGAEDSGHAGYNYGTEPSWFRFGLQPDADTGNANAKSYGGILNPQAMYANSLVANTDHPNYIPKIVLPDGTVVAKKGDPQTPVFRTTADPVNPVFDTRMHVLNGASADRDSTYVLHGHVWQRDPFVCTGAVLLPGGKPGQYWVPPGASDEDDGVNLTGRCAPDAVAPSNALGLNKQAKYMGGEEGMGHVFGHWPILFDAGGTGAVTGDYLFRDYAPNGNRNGMFGILRVEPKQ